MSEWLYSIDKSIFIFINQTLSNAVGDFLWPLITDYDRQWLRHPGCENSYQRPPVTSGFTSQAMVIANW